jgi:hypothetical protein
LQRPGVRLAARPAYSFRPGPTTHRLTFEEIDMAEQQPYLQAYGNITKTLNKIVEAHTPERWPRMKWCAFG